jgi:hypothetical protein
MDPITLDKDLASKLDQGMKAGGTVELPFPVVYLWAVNGQASYKAQGGALYHGGWACKSEDLLAVVEQTGADMPISMSNVSIATRDGGEFDAYVSRSVIVAPIAKRQSWLFDGKRFVDYVEGGRRHVQALCALAHKVDTTYHYWGPVVLTAKGYQARNLLDAFSRWDKETSALRYKIAQGVPAWCFYLAVGTFGKERQAVNVGKPGAQSPITPIGVYTTEKLDEQFLTSLFVGQDVVKQMVSYQDLAADWLRNWDEIVVEQPSAGKGEAPQNWVDEDEGIPF